MQVCKLGAGAMKRTIDASAVEDLTGFTCWACAVALDLRQLVSNRGMDQRLDKTRAEWRTFLLRQLLQFMASRGSLETRRAGRRSMPIWGLDIAAAIDCETFVDIGGLWGRGQEPWSGGE